MTPNAYFSVEWRSASKRWYTCASPFDNKKEAKAFLRRYRETFTNSEFRMIQHMEFTKVIKVK